MPDGALVAKRDAPVGGQAVLEGVMMRGVSVWAVAVRTPEGQIEVESQSLVPWARRHRLWRLPVLRGIVVLLMLIFSKYVYLTSLTSYYTFYLIEHFALSVQAAQLHLFVFLAAVAVGTILGGAIGDRLGRKRVIWLSILGALPFTLLLPHASLFWTGPLTVLIGLVMASAFPAMVVFAQELVPGKVGMISGLFFGLAFGAGGIGAAWLGALADHTSLEYVYRLCAFLPLIGLLAAFLPDVER